MTDFYRELKKELDELKGKPVKRFILKEDRINAAIEDIKYRLVENFILPENITHTNKMEAFQQALTLYIKNTKELRDKYYSKITKTIEKDGQTRTGTKTVQVKFREWEEADKNKYISFFTNIILIMFYKKVRDFAYNRLQNKYLSTDILKLTGTEELSKYLEKANYNIMLTSTINTIKEEQKETFEVVKNDLVNMKEAMNILHASIHSRAEDGTLLEMYLSVRSDENGFKSKYHSPLKELPERFFPQFEAKLKAIEEEQEKMKEEPKNKKKSA